LSATTLLLVNATCSFFGAAIGAFLGVRSWHKQQGSIEEMEE